MKPRVSAIYTKHLALDGIRVRYFEISPKNDKTILIIHGWSKKGGESWLRTGELVAQHGFRVLIPDLPGFGASREPDQAWAIEEYSRFIALFVKRAQLKKPVLLGHSFGGQIALHITAQNPELIEKVILVAPAIIRDRQFDNPSLRSRLAFLLGKGKKYAPQWLRKKLASFFESPDFRGLSSRMQGIMKKIIKQDLRHICPSISVPALIVWGDRDRLTPIQQGYELNRLIKQSLFEVFPGVSHGVHLQIPRQLATLIVGFASEKND